MSHETPATNNISVTNTKPMPRSATAKILKTSTMLGQGTRTSLGAGEDIVVSRGHLLHSLLAVHCAVWQHHGRVVLVHDLPSDRANQLAVHMLRPRQTFSELLELLYAPDMQYLGMQAS